MGWELTLNCIKKARLQNCSFGTQKNQTNAFLVSEALQFSCEHGHSYIERMNLQRQKQKERMPGSAASHKTEVYSRRKHL